MRHLLKLTTIVVALAILPCSLVQGAGHKHRRAFSKIDIGSVVATTTSAQTPAGPSLFLEVSDPANLDTMGEPAIRGDKSNRGLGERAALQNLSQSLAAVPEPSAWVMIGVGAILLAGVLRFRRK